MSDSGRWIENHKNGAISENDKIKIYFFRDDSMNHYLRYFKQWDNKLSH